jgi:hypothetical protein
MKANYNSIISKNDFMILVNYPITFKKLWDEFMVLDKYTEKNTNKLNKILDLIKKNIKTLMKLGESVRESNGINMPELELCEKQINNIYNMQNSINKLFHSITEDEKQKYYDSYIKSVREINRSILDNMKRSKVIMIFNEFYVRGCSGEEEKKAFKNIEHFFKHSLQFRGD